MNFSGDRKHKNYSANKVGTSRIKCPWQKKTKRNTLTTAAKPCLESIYLNNASTGILTSLTRHKWRENVNLMFAWQEQYLTSGRSERVMFFFYVKTICLIIYCRSTVLVHFISFFSLQVARNSLKPCKVFFSRRFLVLKSFVKFLTSSSFSTTSLPATAIFLNRKY